MRPLLATVLAISVFPFAGALLFLGSAIPGQNSGIALVRLSFAGAEGRSLVEVAEENLARGKPGPAQFLIRSINTPASKDLRQNIEARLAEDPFLHVSGGRDPYFSELNKLVENQGTITHTGNGAAGQIISKTSRTTLSQMLSFSENHWVAGILSGQSITGLPNFPPADSPAGAPMETALLSLSLLTQSEALSVRMTRQLVEWVERAKNREVDVLPILDQVFLDTLGLAQRVDWETLRAIYLRAQSWEQITWLNTSLRASDSQVASEPEIIAIWLTVESTDALIEYAQTFPETTWQDLPRALKNGIAAVDLLISEKRPIYVAPEWLSQIYPAAKRAIEQYFIEATGNAPGLLAWMRFTLFALSGALVAAGLIYFLTQADQVEIQMPKAILASGTTAAIFTLVSWALTEPTLLESTQTGTPEIRFNAGPGALMGSFKASIMNPGSIDQVTLLVLGVFLLIQIIIYLVCLVRVSDINKQPVSPSLKIALLENEDSLFDTGLYVGLGGTVLSLILVTLGIVEASIMAAYASTLFGIIFVAALKIFHVRPLRRSLILQNERPL